MCVYVCVYISMYMYTPEYYAVGGVGRSCDDI